MTAIDAPEATAGACKSIAEARVLLVDDDVSVCQHVGAMLEKRGAAVTVAHSGEEGVERFGRQLFDVVVSDVNMPGMDGIQMIRRLHDIDPALAAVVMTSMRDQDTAVRALEAGVACFLSKPFSQEALESKLREAMGERHRLVETRFMIGDLLKLRSEMQHEIETRQRRLTSVEQYLEHLLDATPFGILSVDRNGRILTFNRGAESMYGYQASEILGEQIDKLTTEEQSLAGARETYHLHRDGTRFRVLVHRRDILDTDSSTIAGLFVVEDRSDRERLETQLVQAERLSALGEMAPRIAHEFKTPLQLVIGHAELGLHWCSVGQPEQVQPALERILPAAKQMQVLVEQIANLGRPQEQRQETICMVDALHNTMEPLKHLGVVKYCSLEYEIAENVPSIYGDPAQIEQMLRNLIVNAAQAMQGAEVAVLTLGLRPGGDGLSVEFYVQDTGCGIPEDQLDQVFAPFFTTKDAGTGLGMSIVRTVVDRHNGDIQVDSIPEHGTRIRVRLPAVVTGKNGER